MSRYEWGLAAMAGAACAAAVAFAWQPGLASLFDDSVAYLLMAQWLSPFGEAPAAIAEAARLEKYPPLFPWLLALTGAAHDWRLAHGLVAVSFGASVWLLGRYATLVTGRAWLGLACAALWALMPGAWLNVKGILTEFPYLAVSLLALGKHARLQGHPPSGRAAAALGALLAAAFLLRTIGAALVAGVVVAEVARWVRGREPERLRALAWIVGIPLAAALAWYGLRPAGGEDAYLTFGARVARSATDPQGDLAAIVLANVWAIRDAWLNAMLVFWGEPWKPGFLLAVGTGLAGFAVLAWRAARLEADGLYALAFLAVLVAWPFPGQMFRLALPIAPLVLVGFAWALGRALDRWPSRLLPVAAWLPIAAAAPATLFYVMPRAAIDAGEPHPRKGDIAEFYRIPHGPAAETSAQAQIGVMEDLRRIGETTPEGARVMWHTPNYVALLGRRHGVALENTSDAAHLAAQARAARAGFVYLAELHPRDSARRDGNPVAPVVAAAQLGRVVWHRASASGGIRGILFELDPAKVEAFATRR